MKKSLLLGIFLAISGIAIAEEPHIVPAPGCPVGQICCPEALVCSYLEGCGDTGPWSLIASLKKFEGLKTIKVTKINAEKGESGFYHMGCIYQMGMGYISLSNLGDCRPTLVGSWIYGFMKKSAECATSNSLDCRAK